MQDYKLMKNIIIVSSHPIQYFAPLYKEIAREKDINLNVIYFSDISVKGSIDKQFGTTVKWDIPLLEGYRSIFLKNYAFNPSTYSFFGLLNLGVIPYLAKAPKSIVWIHGWGYFINFLVIFFAKLFGHKVAMRGEMPLHQELLKSPVKQKIRKPFFTVLFKFIDYFLYIGEQNRAFYKYCSVPNKKLHFAPYSVDNERFKKEYEVLKEQKQVLKKQLGIDINAIVVLSSGKYIAKKRPMDLVMAFQKLNLPNITLILMGDGELKPTIEATIKENKLQNILLTGFINQSKISEYYTIADIYVMPSDNGETWGLSTNEAMNFELPVIVSDMSGCAYDLIEEGQNGFVFPVGNIEILAEKLKAFIENDVLREKAGKISKQIVNLYSYQETINALKKIEI